MAPKHSLRRGDRGVRGKTEGLSLRPAARNGRLRVAGMSRKTFYDLFDDREDCLLAVCDDTLERIESELDGANLDDLSWPERMRAGLWIILSFFDRELELACVCVCGAERARGTGRACVARGCLGSFDRTGGRGSFAGH